MPCSWEVEVDLSPGLPYFATVGLPDNIVRESKDRVKTALQNSGYPFPMERITVNLAPAHLKKEGAGFDLPIAVGILAAMGLLDRQMVETGDSGRRALARRPRQARLPTVCRWPSMLRKAATAKCFCHLITPWKQRLRMTYRSCP